MTNASAGRNHFIRAVLLCVALFCSCSCALVIRVGVHGDEKILVFLSSLNKSETARRFNATQLNVTDFVIGPDPESVAQMRSYIESVRANPPDVIVGDYNGTVAAVATELGIPYYCTGQSHSSSALMDTLYLESSSLFLMNSYAENMIEASQRLTSSILQRNTLIIATDGISSSTNTLLNAISNKELHIVMLKDTSSDSHIRDVLYNVSLRANIGSAVFQTAFTNETSLAALLPEAARLSLMRNTTYWIVTDLFSNSNLLLSYRRTGADIYSFALPASSNVTDTNGLRLAMAEDSIGHYMKSIGGAARFDLSTALSTTYHGLLGTIHFDASTRRNSKSQLRIMVASHSLNYIAEFGIWEKINTDGVTITRKGAADTLPHLRILAFLKDPYIMKSGSEYYGFVSSVLRDASSGLFTWEVIEVANEAMLLPMLQRGEGDMVANPMLLPLDGANVSYAPWPVMYTGLAAMGHSEDREADFLNPAYPFSWNVWIAVILAFLILSVTLYSIDKISPNDYKRPKFSIPESVFFVYSSFMMSKLRSTAVKPSSRIFILILWFASLMYCTTYGTNFFFMQIRSNRALPFQSLYGLYNSTDRYYTILVQNSTAMNTLSAFPPGSYYKELSEPDLLVESETKAVSLVFNMSLQDRMLPIYIGDQAMIKFYVAKSCQLKMTSSDEMHRPLYLPVRPTLSGQLLLLFTLKIQVLSDRGILDQYQDTHWSAIKCSSNENLINVSELKAVRIEEVAGIFILLACALVFSFVVLLLEHALHLAQLKLQRTRADPGLEFMKPYKVQVTSVTPQGVYVNVRNTREFLPNQMLSPDPSKKMSAADLQIYNDDFIDVIFLGNDPITGDRLFKRTG